MVGSPLTVFVSHVVEALLNSPHTQHFSVSRLTSYEVLLLTTPHIILLCCSNLNPVTFLPSIFNKIPHDCLTLTDHLLTPYDDLQEAPLSKLTSPASLMVLM